MRGIQVTGMKLDLEGVDCIPTRHSSQLENLLSSSTQVCRISSALA